jgi:hypothetical protein
MCQGEAALAVGTEAPCTAEAEAEGTSALAFWTWQATNSQATTPAVI